MDGDAFAYWGKARGGVHPLCWHLIDVGACAQALLDAQPMRHRALAAALSLSPVEARAWAGFLAALHDVGKLAVGFQRKAPEHAPHILAALPPTGPVCDHTVEGAALLAEHPPAGVFDDAEQGRALTDAVAGHHGRPVRDPVYLFDTFGAPGLAAYARIVAALRSVFAPPCLPALGGAGLEAATWRLAGLTTLADWLGSDRERFAHAPPGDPAAYVRRAAGQACAAVEAAGLEEARGAAPDATVFLPPGATPTPMQAAAAAIPIPGAPALFVIEDATGAGKTETAAILTARLIGAGRACGAFFALPTMATANAMHGRMQGGHTAFHRAFFAPGETPSLALAHGRADLNEAFTAALSGADEGGARGECAAWFAGETRRALLADIGVGTVDQALLAALPSRFQALRLYGLADKVLVLDEVHAYDPYMIAGIERLLAFQARLGGSAILLSATLPGGMRDRLERAWTGETARVPGRVRMPGTPAAPAPPMPERPDDPLPLLSVVSMAGKGREVVAAAAHRRVAVERLGSVEEGEARIVAAAARGAACLYLRNSVDDARETVARLRAAGVPATLFHARYAMGDRLDIEAAVLRTYGKGATTARRRGRVLVATQVVEQSLDLDFDVMVSDLAPLDLLIQRAGRLRRHDRAGRPVVEAPLMVVSPDPGVVDAGWPRALLPRTSAVYRDDALLWRSARALFAAGEIVTPGGARTLVEAVYGGRAEPAPPALERRAIEAEGQERAHRSIGVQTFLSPANAYTWSRDPVIEGRAPTRLGEASVTLRLTRWEGGALVPWSGEGGRRGWALSEVSVGPWVATGVPEPTGALADAVARATAEWGRWEAETVTLLPLEPDGPVWRGRGLGPDGDGIALAYSPEDGLSRP